jgi:hypothetical protein
MKTATHDETEKEVPQKLKLGDQVMQKQMSEAGISRANMKSAFGQDFSRRHRMAGIEEEGSRGRSDALPKMPATGRVEGRRGLMSEDDLKALGQVGPIAASNKAKANDAVEALIKDPQGNRGRASAEDPIPNKVAGKNMLEISVYPGSARPLRARVSPTSIGFWKTLDAQGVDTRK